jgi:hypothetical protein
MSEFKMEVRLPVRVLRRAPFIYSGSDFRSLILGAFSECVTHRGSSFQRTYPLLVSSEPPHRHTGDRVFTFAFLYVDTDDRRRLILTHPVPLEGEEEALEALLSGAHRLASSLGCISIDVEVHEAAGPQAFPTSLTPISYDLRRAVLVRQGAELLMRRGFRVEGEIICLDADIGQFLRGLKIDVGPIENIVSASPSEAIELERGAEAFSLRPFSLSLKDTEFRPWKNTPFLDGSFLVKFGGKGRTGEKAVDGFVRWSPDLFEALEEVKTPYPSLLHEHLIRGEFRSGKVYDWGFKTRDEEPIISLLSAAAGSMRGRNIERIQFGYLNSRERFLGRNLERRGFKVTHRIKLFRRAVGDWKS